MANRINNVDIGELNDISGLSTSHEKVCGKYRNPAFYILDLAKFYIEVDNGREDKLKTFESFSKKDPSSFLFAMAIGGDAAPGTGMAILISFLNVGERLPSSKEQFLLFGGDCEESSNVVYNFFKILIKDIRFLESKVFEITTSDRVRKVEFKLTELPNDMKMLAFLAGELSNAATYFCTFANVKRDEANDYQKTFGEAGGNYWKPFTYEKRVQDAIKVEAKKRQLEAKKSSPGTLHGKILTYISHELKSRQYKYPLVEEFIDLAKAEPLHLKNNVVKERFMILFKLFVSQCHFGSAKSFKEITNDNLFSRFVNFVRKEMKCNFLAKKIERWFNDNSGKVEKEFTFRFRGKESFHYIRYFPSLIKMLLGEIKEVKIKLKILEVHLQSIHLRNLLSYTVRISDFDVEDLRKMKHEAFYLFKCCDSKISPSLWTLCNVVPFHAGKCLNMYNMGLGCNTMEGREQKHQMISKYAENSTYQNRHEYIQLIYLRENGYDNIKYTKKSVNYIEEPAKGFCLICNLQLKEIQKDCPLCKSSLMTFIKNRLNKVL